MTRESDSPGGRRPTAPGAVRDAASGPARTTSSPARGLLWKLGLHRPELRAWAMYDWANSAFVTVIMTAVFPIYFSKVACAGLRPETATSRYALATTLGLVIIAVLSPVLGAMADFLPIKKWLLGFFLSHGVVTVALMFFVDRGDWLLAVVLFILSNIAVNGSFVFYDALLPHVAREDEMDRVSTAGYALGYVGGGLLLAVNLLMILKPNLFGLPDGTLPTRLAFLSVALWWLVFSIPLFLRVREPEIRVGSLPGSAASAFPVLPVSEAERPATPSEPGVRPAATGEEGSPVKVASPVRSAFAQLAQTFRELRGYRNAFLMLLAFLVYNDGIGTIIRMAAIYGTEIGIAESTLIAAILITQFVGIPFAFLFGGLAGRIGTRPSILLGLAVYTFISLVGYFMKTGTHFLILAVMVGMVQGGTQALSRSLFASLIPRYQSGQFFGFFAVVEKFAGIFGPAVFTAMIYLTGTSRAAILSVIAFFVVGALLLLLVKVEEGQRIAREAESRARPAV